MRAAACLLGLVLAAPPAHAAETATERPAAAYVGIIVDDLGNSWADGQRALRLPGPVACAILPHTPFARRLANAAQRHDKEVILHLPMQSRDGAEPGPGNLEVEMRETQFTMMFDYDLSTVPHVVGVNNHMGSLLTTQTRHMDWLMREIRRRGDLFFVDSRTTPDTVAMHSAAQHGIPTLARDVFLDRSADPAAIDQQFENLIRLAQRRGSAVAIGHPHPTTLDALERWLPQLATHGIQLVSLSTLLARRGLETKPWHTSSSR